MRDRFPPDRQVALYVLGGLVAVIGLFGLIAARSIGFTEAPGVEVVDVSADYIWGRQFAFNLLGALCAIGVGVATIVVAATRLRRLALGTAVTALLIALLTLTQLGADDQILGSRAGNVALLVANALALAAISATPSLASDGSSRAG